MTQVSSHCSWQVLRDSRLFLTVGALVVVNLGVLVLRTVLDHITVVPVDVGNPVGDRYMERPRWLLVHLKR